MSVSVGTGMALVQGRYYINDDDLTLNVEAADPSHPRIDRVVVRLEATPGRTVHAVVKKGTPAPSPGPAEPDPDGGDLGALACTGARGGRGYKYRRGEDHRRERQYVALRGSCAGLCAVVAGGGSRRDEHAGEGVDRAAGAERRDGRGTTGYGRRNVAEPRAPVNANDAARKAYVDAKVAGFGISQIAIDANKDWNGKNITNVGEISGLAFTPTISKMRFVHVPDPEKAPENVVASDLSEVSTSSTEYILAKTFPAVPTMGYVSHDSLRSYRLDGNRIYRPRDRRGEVDIRAQRSIENNAGRAQRELGREERGHPYIPGGCNHSLAQDAECESTSAAQKRKDIQYAAPPGGAECRVVTPIYPPRPIFSHDQFPNLFLDPGPHRRGDRGRAARRGHSPTW